MHKSQSSQILTGVCRPQVMIPSYRRNISGKTPTKMFSNIITNVESNYLEGLFWTSTEQIKTSEVEPLIETSILFSPIYLRHIVSDNKKLKLAKPIIATIDFRDDMWVMENKDLSIISMATDYNECFRDFNDEVLFVWNEYGKADDDELTRDARQLKNKILRYVKREALHHSDLTKTKRDN